ncbi:S24 family peptidase [Flavobacterium branchiarum]|uniref:S24 family peptidase n=1 Tax=Flavobacterium branchiarum TaxID=1114870 RepID=A0ABV5FPY4_9FLAO|nr:S24 family peptidase [Flavobacterium branchiarum]MDN3673113.1 S24 family peptidase [Flavobacterium branchiarum]
MKEQRYTQSAYYKNKKENILRKMSTQVDKKLILNKIKDWFKFEKDSDFARFLGIKPQTLSSWHSRNTFDIELLYSKCVNINPDFLFTGKEPVIKKIIETKELEELSAVYRLKTDNNVDNQSIPLYNLEATAGIVSLFKDSKENEPIDFIKIPNLPKCDGAIYVSGDSMYPLLKSGDIVMYKQIHNIKDGIYWGEMYLISVIDDGSEMVMVKYIKKSEKEGYIKLVSQNQHHQERDIPLKKVKALALIKASIRINSMS